MRLRSSVDHITETEMLTQGFRFAMGECPFSSYALDTLGVANYRAGNYEQALDVLSRSDQIQRAPRK